MRNTKIINSAWFPLDLGSSVAKTLKDLHNFRKTGRSLDDVMDVLNSLDIPKSSKEESIVITCEKKGVNLSANERYTGIFSILFP
eukprot:UN28542